MRRVIPQLASDSMEASIAFWCEGLGFRRVEVPDRPPEIVVVEHETYRIELWPRDVLADRGAGPLAATLSSFLVIEVDDLRAIPEELTQQTNAGPPGSPIALVDPGGNLVMLREHRSAGSSEATELPAPASGVTPEASDDTYADEDLALTARHPVPELETTNEVPALVDTRAPPHIARIVPETVATEGGAVLSIFGTGLELGSQIRVGGIACSVRTCDEDRLEVTSPALPEGAVDVEVVATDGQSTRAAAALRVRPAPSVTAIRPAESDLAGGTTLVIVGRHFTPGARVTFFDRAPEATFVSETELHVVCPSRDAPGVGTVRVHSPEGLVGTLADAFRYTLAEPPRLDGVSPGRAWTSGGLHVTITGAHFRSGTKVALGGAPARVVSVAPEKIVVEVPPVPEPGVVDVAVDNPDGQSAVGARLFTFERPPAPPKLIEVTPSIGQCGGGQTLRLAGDNFDEDTVVRIGELTAPVRFLSRNTLEVVSPARREAGPVVVELSDRKGIVVRVEGLFSYASRPPPIVTGIEPPSGFAGHRVRIEGHHFAPGSTVRFARESAKAIVVDDGAIDVVVPPTRTPGTVDVTVFSEGGEGVLKGAFRYETLPAPFIESIAPTAGNPAGGTELSIVGRNFVQQSRVVVGGRPAASVKFVDETTLEVETPPGKDGEMADVVVKNPDGAEAQKRRAFVYDRRYG